MKRVFAIVLLLSVAIAASASAGPYVGGGLEYGWFDRTDITKSEVEPVLVGGFEFGDRLVLDINGAVALPVFGTFNESHLVDREPRNTIRAVLKFKF